MMPVEYPIHERILSIQRVVLGHVFDPAVLSRIQNNTLKVDTGTRPLTLAEVFRATTDGIWVLPDGKERTGSSVLRRNLQRAHLGKLFALVLGERGGDNMIFIGFAPSASVPPDARSLARMHLRDISKRIDTLLNGKHASQLDDTCRAHLEESRDRIAKALSASMQVHEP